MLHSRTIKKMADIIAKAGEVITARLQIAPLPKHKRIKMGVSHQIRLMRSLAVSIFLYACETWTFTAELQRRVQAMEMRCYQKILCISYKDHVTNEEVHNRITQAIGPYEDLLTTVKRQKLKWYGHVSRA